MFFSDTRLIVRYAETDRMGIVHHSNYPIWFEAGRTDFIRKLGMSYSVIEDRGLLLPLIEISCRYRGAARYEDEVSIRTTLKEISYTRITFHYDVYRNSEDRPITNGETTHVFADRQLKPVNIRKYMPDIYQLLHGAAAE